MKQFALAAATAFFATVAQAQTDVITYTTDESFEDVVFGLENAIVDAGLVVDSVSHVGDMLERTKADVGSDVTIFAHADTYSFCSAAISRRVMEADPMNVVFCPYDIFVIQRPGDDKVTIGFRDYPDGAMQAVEDLLDGIARAAIGLN
ncbi:DUF302 domain-containing protein [Marimonas arenosa]|uniref:DUF302 domain-containing protein n=1 Tax=Marimonas arenosa TaxID=1795305 RepID=A0AAE4B442_9RHOB|nr:DUF302 domain-containing protein [Marimonas arenosa]MDQ2090678.1 DUF302 domain-containing protein [Marimonas arenosa]